jgi:hypothetical protein
MGSPPDHVFIDMLERNKAALVNSAYDEVRLDNQDVLRPKDRRGEIGVCLKRLYNLGPVINYDTLTEAQNKEKREYMFVLHEPSSFDCAVFGNEQLLDDKIKEMYRTVQARTKATERERLRLRVAERDRVRLSVTEKVNRPYREKLDQLQVDIDSLRHM